ncbi:cytochrome c (plasmid) [Pseudomonas silvicola]|nr:cytochrome c [Pseudomonas silvicola]
MTAEDRQAIDLFVTTGDSATAEPAQANRWTLVRGDDTPQAVLSEGAQIYRNNCASCHNLTGEGLNGLPALQNHPLNKPNADNVAMAVLQGVWPEKGQGMIGFAGQLNDHQIAALTNYVMQDIGHSKVQISEERVKSLRAGGDASPLMLVSHAHAAGYRGAGAVLVRFQKKEQTLTALSL